MTATAPNDAHDVIARLRAANPAELDSRRSHYPAARAALERILADASPDDAPPLSLARLRGRLPTRSARGLAAVGAMLIVGAGGALAATDPMNWWSAAPDRASYASTPSVVVATPSAVKIRCRIEAGGDAVCTPTSTLRRGLTYVRIGSIPRPQLTSAFSRRSLLAHVRAARAQGRISQTGAARLWTDIAAVPGSFFTTMAPAGRYGTFGIVSRTPAGKILVPPAGTPAFLVCQDAPGGRLSCRNLNGDSNAPVGAGVYAV
ncbi:MAG: hypothetical protein ACRDL8_03320, partial [Solirubrobacteraceae bacterium]